MKRKVSYASKRKTSTNTNGELYVIDIAQYLSELAKVYALEETGSPRLNYGLKKLTDALRPYFDLPISELGHVIHPVSIAASIRTTAENKTRPLLPSDVESIDHNALERILDDERYSKEQVAELGTRRFGISRAKLIRLRKQEAVEAVRSALGHAKSLDAIAHEARRAGHARTSWPL